MRIAQVAPLFESVPPKYYGGTERVVSGKPLLPECLRQVQIRGLRVGDSRLDLRLVRARGDVAVDVLRRDGWVEVVTVE